MGPRVTVDSLHHEGSSLLQSTQTSSDTHQDDAVHQQKSIGTIGSLTIAINALAGPAVLQLPFQYQQSGLVPTTLCLLAVAGLSIGCCQCTAWTVSALPDNSKFVLPIEFSDAFAYFGSPRMYRWMQILFFGCTLCLNLASMIDTAEVVDTTLGVSVGTLGLDITNGAIQTWSHLPCTRKSIKLGQCDPFSDVSSPILTLGYVITAAVFLPICLMHLKENTAWQIWGCSLLVTLSLYLSYVFLHLNHHDGTSVWQELDPRIPTPMQLYPNVTLWGHEWSNLLGVILFNFALVLAIPAWLHEKQPNVQVSHVIVTSTVIATALYILVGALAAWAIPHANVNMLNPMVSGAFGTERVANLIVVWIPWSLAWLLYQGDAVGGLLDWGGTLLTSALAFILPLYLTWRVLVYNNATGSVPLPFSTRSAQTRVVTILLVLTVAAIVVAVAGQIAATDKIEETLHAEDYLNGRLR